MVDENPAMVSGKICYLEIPTTDVQRSADFYRRVFGWESRRHDDGSLAFDDTTGQVSGSWVTDRAVGSAAGLTVYIMVADAAATLDAIRAEGGSVARPVDPALDEIFAWFRDPDGNTLGIYQQPGLAEAETAAERAR